MGTVFRIALVLVIIGALNWGLIGLFQYDLVADLFGGQDAMLSRWVYGLVGLGGILTIPVLFKRFEDNIDTSPRPIKTGGNAAYQMEAGKEVDFTDVKAIKKDPDKNQP